MRKRILKVISVILTAIIILPVLQVRNTEAAMTASQKAAYVGKYLYENGSYSLTANGETYKGYYIKNETNTNQVSYVTGNADGSSIRFTYQLVNNSITWTYTMVLDTSLMWIVNGKVYAEAKYNGRTTMMERYVNLNTYNGDVNSNAWTITKHGYTDLEDSFLDVIRVSFASSLQDIDALLMKCGFSLGFIGFKGSKYNHAVYSSGNWNGAATSTQNSQTVYTYTNTTALNYSLRLKQNTTASYLIYKLYRDGTEIFSTRADIYAYGQTSTSSGSFPLYKCDITFSLSGVLQAGEYRIVIVDPANQNVIRQQTCTVVENSSLPTSTPYGTSRPTNTVAPTNTTAPTSAVPSLPAFNPNAGGTGVEGFVNRLYSIVLNREGDVAGQEYWVNNLRTKQNTGGDVARLFLTSSEFEAIGYSDEQFVEILYRVFFNRSGDDDSSGMEFWLNALNNGATRDDVIRGFINSNEWATLCASYDIVSGGTGIAIAIDRTKIRNFVSGLYYSCLHRLGDEDGIEYWVNSLANRSIRGTEVARTFFFSDEFVEMNVSNDEYVRRLYRAFLLREGSDADVAYWLSTGLSKEALFYSFAQSNEFVSNCEAAGIKP